MPVAAWPQAEHRGQIGAELRALASKPELPEEQSAAHGDPFDSGPIGDVNRVAHPTRVIQLLGYRQRKREPAGR